MKAKKLIGVTMLALFAAAGVIAKPKAVAGKDSLTLSAYTIQSANVVNPETGNTLRGTLYLPQKTGKLPLVITAHELGSNDQRRWPFYGQSLASHGVAVYTFDFAGGGPKTRADGAPGSRSDGETTEMSVLTEVRDLEAVLAETKKWSFVDTKKIVIIGGSQGGAVSIVAAGRHADEVAGLVIMYPALYELEKLIHAYPSAQDFPESLVMWGMVELGRKYATDMWDFSFDESIASYTKPVLLLHGDKDTIVPFSDSEKLQKAYKNATLRLVPNGTHGFHGETFEVAIGFINEYLKEIGVVK